MAPDVCPATNCRLRIRVNASSPVLQGSYCRFGAVVVEPDHIEPGLLSCGIAAVPAGTVRVSISFDGEMWSEAINLRVIGLHGRLLGGGLAVAAAFLGVLIWLVVMACRAKQRPWADRALAANRLASVRPRPAYL
jgi:hypothetical protein